MDRYDEKAEKLYGTLTWRWESNDDLIPVIAAALRQAASEAYEDAASRCSKVGYSQSASSQAEYFRAKSKSVLGGATE